MRHALASTVDIYGRPWRDADETTRAAVGKVIAARLEHQDAARSGCEAPPRRLGALAREKLLRTLCGRRGHPQSRKNLLTSTNTGRYRPI